MLPVVTPTQMQAVDAAAPEPVEVLIDRAGAAVARHALEMLGGAYGRRVVVVAGRGNNGADGRSAARVLARRGARVMVIDAAGAPGTLPEVDLVIDAAYGTGFRGTYVAPDPGAAPVLAVDIPSGLDGSTGGAGPGSEPARAVRTVTFAALKPGLLLGAGPVHAGRVELAGIGLDAAAAEQATAWLVQDRDLARIPGRSRDAHKWQSALVVVAGSPGMMGAPELVGRAAMRAGAGYVRLGIPGASLEEVRVGEAVAFAVPADDWHDAILDAAERCRAIVVGPGLGTGPAAAAALRRIVADAAVPVVVDADGLNNIGSAAVLRALVARRPTPVVVTPHEGEYARLFGRHPGRDRIEDVRDAALATGAIVLLKGPTTVVAAPDGRVLLATAGSPRLATAGTGDVLAGVIGACIARGVAPFEAAGIAAHLHGRAAALGRMEGLIAGDLPDLVADVLSTVPR